MKKNMLYILKGFASLSIGMGFFQFLSANNVFPLLEGNMNYIPALVIICISFCLVYYLFKKDRKFQIPVLIILIIAGASASSMFGHKSGMNHMKQYEVPID